MRTKARISGIYKNTVGHELFQQLERVCPEGITGAMSHVFACELDEANPKFREIVSILNAHGLRAWDPYQGQRDKQVEYSLLRVREYDLDDLAPAGHLVVAPKFHTDGGRTEAGELIINDVAVGWESSLIGITTANGYAISEAQWNGLRHFGLQGPSIQPAHLFEKRNSEEGESGELVDWECHSGERWWELSTDREMPPLSPSMDIYDGKGSPVEPGYPRSWTVREDHYLYPELRYRRSDIEAMPPFDLALTCEGRQGGTQHLIASNRFWRACRELGIETGWIPVRIDEE